MIRVIQDEDDTGEYHMLDYKPDPLVLAAVILPCIACLFMIILMIVLLKKNSKQKFLKFCHFGGDGEKQSASHSGTTADGGEATIKNEAVQYNAVTQNVNDAYTRTPDTLRALGATPVNNLEDGDKPDEIEPLLRLGVTGTNNDKPHSDSDEDTQRQSQNRDGIYAQPTDHDESTNAASTNPAQSSGLKGIQSAVVVADVHYPGQPNDPSLIDSAKKISLEEKMKLARGVPLEDLLGNYTVMDKINGLLTPESETNSPLHIKSYRDLAIAVGMPYINVAKSARHVIEYIKASSEGDRDVSTLMKGLNTIKSFDVMDEVYAWLLNRQKEKT
uniref:Uncharacterized protein LOC102805782 n=1 Tax=Saccoglossus kowalevskii TaxID=10224 RepID=A0ABM0LUA1_SACKO|nr:PREDICTED: uncharacterized protein LOC102805782 [Saccoglossus kowalevskii]